MKNLEQESEEYLKYWRGRNNIHLSNILHAERCKNDFMAGANSKWVQQLLKNCWETAHQAGRFEGKGIAEQNWQSFKSWCEENNIKYYDE
jgi:hypothetical protein